jgi:hypothetical protein
VVKHTCIYEREFYSLRCLPDNAKHGWIKKYI